ncbi:hypothetical protein U0070_005003 [Myodes glareolus]|uniref:Uncharacterized protein n=1 Tax=Myodes glareolus TaxID=447135 RepID=A0AAW0K4Y8_MYOGA
MTIQRQQIRNQVATAMSVACSITVDHKDIIYNVSFNFHRYQKASAPATDQNVETGIALRDERRAVTCMVCHTAHPECGQEEDARHQMLWIPASALQTTGSGSTSPVHAMAEVRGFAFDSLGFITGVRNHRLDQSFYYSENTTNNAKLKL